MNLARIISQALLSFAFFALGCQSPSESQVIVKDDSNALPLKKPKNEKSKTKDKKDPEKFGPSIWDNSKWNQGYNDIPIKKFEYKIDLDDDVAKQIKGRDSIDIQKEKLIPLNANQQKMEIAVLCYHHNFHGKKSYEGFNITPAKFEKQLKYLVENGYNSISLHQLDLFLNGQVAHLPKKSVLLSFDDGLKSNLTTVLPLLKKYNFKAVLFIYPGIISQNTKSYLKWKQLRTLVASGSIEIGSHSLNHPRLPEHSRKEIKRQLIRSKNILEKKLGIKIISFAYPYGVYDRRVIEEVKFSGYRMAFTIHPGTNSGSMNRYTLNRYMVMGSHSLKTFANNLKMKSSSMATIFPGAGSRINAGDTLSLSLPNFNNIKIKLGKKTLKYNRKSGRIIANLPSVQSKLGYLPLQIRARNKKGDNIYREILYLDKRKFHKQ